MNNTSNSETNQQGAQKITPLVNELMNIANKEAVDFKATEASINKLLAEFDNLMNGLVSNIRDDIQASDLDKKLGDDMSEEDIDKMLILYGEVSTGQIETLTLAAKRKKVVALIEDEGTECREYDLATKTRVASLKNKLIEVVKTEVLTKFKKKVEAKVKTNNEPVEQKRADLANLEEYKQQKVLFDHAHAERAIKRTIKKRKAKRKSAMNAAAEAGISAALDDCVEQTRKNINASFDNAVVLTQAAMNVRVQENKDPRTVVEADEIREEVLQTMKGDSKYQLSEIEVGADKVNAQLDAAKNAVKDLEKVSQPV